MIEAAARTAAVRIEVRFGILSGALAAMLAASCAHAEQASDDPFAHPASGAELRTGLLSEAIAEVERSQVLEGAFTQQRTLRGLPKPLESRGRFLLVRDLGLQWHTLEPVEDEFVLTRAGLRERRAGNARSRRPQFGPATELLFALFSLDLDALDRRFELFGAGSTQDWQIGMRPRDNATARAIRQAVVRGGDRVQSIALVNGAGDQLLIELRDVSVRADGLSAELRAIFQ